MLPSVPVHYRPNCLLVDPELFSQFAAKKSFVPETSNRKNLSSGKQSVPISFSVNKPSLFDTVSGVLLWGCWKYVFESNARWIIAGMRHVLVGWRLQSRLDVIAHTRCDECNPLAVNGEAERPIFSDHCPGPFPAGVRSLCNSYVTPKSLNLFFCQFRDWLKLLVGHVSSLKGTWFEGCSVSAVRPSLMLAGFREDLCNS